MPQRILAAEANVSLTFLTYMLVLDNALCSHTVLIYIAEETVKLANNFHANKTDDPPRS